MVCACTRNERRSSYPEQLERLKRLARRDGRSVGAVIRDAVDAYTLHVADRHAAIERLLALEAPVDDWPVMKAEYPARRARRTVTVFLDTAIFMYAGGADHPLRASCGAILRRVDDGDLDATTSVEVVQEILHRYVSIKRADTGIAMAREVLDVFAPVLPLTHAVMRRLPPLVTRYPGLSARDLIHVATCLVEGIEVIISPDRAFDQVREIRRLDPIEVAKG